MATVTGFTSERMLEIEQSTVVDGEVQGDNLILITRGGTEIDAGSVRGPQGIPGPPADGHAILDEGVALMQRPALNFVGGGITVIDDAVNSRTMVDVPFTQPGHAIQKSGSPVTQRTNLNFTGRDVSITDDSANNRTVVNIPPTMIFWEKTTDAYETGDMNTSFLNLWDYQFNVIAGHVYEFDWLGNMVGRTAGSYIAGSVRTVWDGPNEAGVILNGVDVWCPAAAVIIGFRLLSTFKALTSGLGTVSIQAARAWWSSVGIRMTRRPDIPQQIIVRDLGAI